MSKNYSTAIASAINNFLTTDDWRFSFDEEKGRFTFNLKSNGKMRTIRYVIDVEERMYKVYGGSDIAYADTDDEQVMIAMSEFVNRANYDLKVGNFEFDYRDGEVRYKCSAFCGDTVPTFEMVRHSVYLVASMFNRYGDGIFDVGYAGVSASEAIRKCEA